MYVCMYVCMYECMYAEPDMSSLQCFLTWFRTTATIDHKTLGLRQMPGNLN
jgi:hypothetical protein